MILFCLMLMVGKNSFSACAPRLWHDADCIYDNEKDTLEDSYQLRCKHR